jgi:(p)ppGpp synthase/HD superfamily hydrolase
MKKENNLGVLDKAIALAVKAHSGQLDKAGRPYILHPLRLLLRFEDEKEMAVAALHDVVEDSDLSIEDLVNEGFSEDIVNAVDCLSRREAEEYDDFILRISKSQLAKKVKIEDIKDNLNLARLSEVTDKDLERVEKYHRALKKLESS